MKIELLTKVFQTVFLATGLSCISIAVSAQSPYAMFGDKSVMLEAKAEPINNIYRVQIQTGNENKYFADFDFEKGIATLSDMAGNIVLQDSISENAKAMFTTLDPHSESYYNLSPYSYCGGNPVNAIDPDGRDYWSTNDINQITQFLNAVGRGQSQFDFSGWNHATDAEFCGNLVYNDETHKFYTSYAEVKNGELVVTGKSFDANITPVSATGAGYPGAFVYEPASGFLENANYFLNGGFTYNDGQFNWNVNRSGRITGVAPIMGIADFGGKSKMSFLRSSLPKGFKLVKGIYSHNEKVYQYKGKYYSLDNTSHNGGVWKVFEMRGGRLVRIGTADKNLNIFKR